MKIVLKSTTAFFLGRKITAFVLTVSIFECLTGNGYNMANNSIWCIPSILKLEWWNNCTMAAENNHFWMQ